MSTAFEIAFVTDYDALDVRTFSGVGHFMAQALERNVGRVNYVNVALDRGSRRLTRAFSELAPRAVKAIGHRATTLVGQKSYDLVFCPGSLPVARLETEVPIVLWKDATFASLEETYFVGLSRRSRRHGNLMERSALARASVVFFASEWAAAEAVARYGSEPPFVSVVPWGANLNEDPGPVGSARSPADVLQLLFVGRPWERKGGSIAIGVLSELRDRGIDVELTIVGPVPDVVRGTTAVVVYEHFDKRDPLQRAGLDALYRAADFLLFPSRAEAYGAVACEAAAYGIPVVGADVGGIPTIVKNQETGFTLPLDAGPSAYAECILGALRGDYIGLRRAARARFESTLNWDAAAQSVAAVLEERLKD